MPLSTDATPEGQWYWATQAAEAITRMQQLASEAISQGRDAADPAALAAQVRLFRSAALIRAAQTAARSGSPGGCLPASTCAGPCAAIWNGTRNRPQTVRET
jgi:hypothetical protein